MPLIKLAIKPEFRDLLPALSAEERSALEKSILTEGCRDPIVTWGSIIVDGHNRYDICIEHGVQYHTVAFYGGPDFDYLPSMADKEEAVKRWIIGTQLARRNLTDEQRALYLGILYNSAKAEPVDNLKKGYAGSGSEKPNSWGTGSEKPRLNETDPIGQNVHSEKSESTAAKIAREHGVNEKTVRRAGEFAIGIDRIGKVDPAIREKILSGASKSVVSMGQVRALAGASEERVKAAVRAVAENKPLEREPVTRSAGAAGNTTNPDATLGEIDPPISPGVTCVNSAGQLNSPTAAKQGVKPPPEDAPSPASAEPLGGGGQFTDLDVPAYDGPVSEKRPEAVKFYADAWLAGTAAMTLEQRGAYITLLMMELSAGPLDKDAMLSVTAEKKTAWPDKIVFKKFQITDNDTYVSPRMEKEVLKAVAHSAMQSDRASKRWNNNGGETDSAAECRGNAAAMPGLKDLKDKTKQDKQKDVYPAPLSQVYNKAVNVLSVDVKDKTVGVTDGAGADGVDQSTEENYDQTAVEEFDQTADEDDCAENAQPPKKSPPRRHYGTFKHVMLTDDQYRALVAEWGEPEAQKWIHRVDDWCQETGNRKKDYSRTIRKWRNNGWGESGKNTQSKPLTSGRTVYEHERKSLADGKYDNLVPDA
ncbi:hypothetical protein R80B4_00936 [Fibrobacteres bacterium R8-0-B4]